MRLSLRSTHPGIARENGSVHVEVTLDPGRPATQPGKARRPVALCLVFDRSGSMGGLAGGWEHGPDYYSGPIYLTNPPIRPDRPRTGHPPVHGRTKMDFVKSAAHYLVDSLVEGDFISLVSFSSSARVEVPMTRVSSWTGSAMHEAVARFGPEDSTNLFEGMLLGEKEFGPALPTTHSCKIILLSDGLANVGVTSPGGMADFALAAHRRGIAISALGVGLDYSAEVMGTLAQCGGGSFHHIAEAYRLPQIVVAELESAAAVRARRVQIELTAGPLVAIGENLNLYHQEPGPNGVVVELGDLLGPRSVVLELSTPAGFPSDEVQVKVAGEWEDSDGAGREGVAVLPLRVVSPVDFETLRPDADLLREVYRLIEARTARLAGGAYEAGDDARRRSAMASGMAVLDRLAVCSAGPAADAEARSARGRLRELGDRFERHDVSAAESKEVYQQTFNETTGRTGRGRVARRGQAD